MTHIITTAMPNKVSKLIKFCYKRFTLRDFNDEILGNQTHKDYYYVVSNLNDRGHEELQRIINLKQIGTTIGANWFASMVIVFIKFILSPEFLDICLFTALFSLSVILILLGWIKTLQQMEFINDHK